MAEYKISDIAVSAAKALGYTAVGAIAAATAYGTLYVLGVDLAHAHVAQCGAAGAVVGMAAYLHGRNTASTAPK